MDFRSLKDQGKTVIYRETETNEQLNGWELWGERTTPTERVYVHRKIVTFEEAEQHKMENILLD